jgi:hypothetical protein
MTNKRNTNTKRNRNKSNFLRKIIIENEEYLWSVDSYDCDGDGGYKFKIWKDKKLIYQQIIHNTIITPKIVDKKIRELKENKSIINKLNNSKEKNDLKTEMTKFQLGFFSLVEQIMEDENISNDYLVSKLGINKSDFDKLYAVDKFIDLETMTKIGLILGREFTFSNKNYPITNTLEYRHKKYVNEQMKEKLKYISDGKLIKIANLFQLRSDWTVSREYEKKGFYEILSKKPEGYEFHEGIVQVFWNRDTFKNDFVLHYDEMCFETILSEEQFEKVKKIILK